MTALLTISEVSAILRCGRNRVYELLKSGVLTRGAKYGRRTVVLADSVTAALETPYERAPPVKPKRLRARAGFNAAIDQLYEETR